MFVLVLLPLPPLSERRYCDAGRHAVCVSAALVSVAKVMCCIQCCLVLSSYCCILLFWYFYHNLYNLPTV